ncbi:hypothetical protein [Streptomyces ochraceiscleroticus]|uniref:Serine/threonine protein kinase n=1 Tax=Streptomyces ochraceiscleroticus TaxID=47761 RepID=A0ABW1MCN6_9ACTN|nr:hypothetical protein [Streptomyces ochraceiscleroticus]
MAGEWWRRGRSTVWGGAVAVLLIAGGFGTWITGSWPFGGDRDRYCWGAWETESGPEFLADSAVEDGGRRTVHETAPTPERPRGRCTVALRTDESGGSETRTEITVTYGPAPQDAARRMEWILTYLGDSAVPLPDGLPGATDGSHALLVLPKRCDTRDGRPTAVTLDSDARRSWHGGTSRTSAGIGGARPAAGLVVAAANRGMKAAGCAPERDLRFTSPVLTLPEGDEIVFTRACRIRGMEFDDDATQGMRHQVGAATRDLQSCSVGTWGRDGGPVLDALMVAQPRLNALFDGAVGDAAPARGWRGTGVRADSHQVLRADCAGRSTTFLLRAPSIGEAAAGRYFAAFTNAVTQRLGCAPVAPAADAAPGGTGR